MAETTIVLPPEAAQQARMFKQSLPMQIKMHETPRSLGSTEGETCLDIGAGNGMMSHHLRKRGGNWNTVVTSESVAASVREIFNNCFSNLVLMFLNAVSSYFCWL